MPCPFCGAHTCAHTIEGHIARAHPEHSVYLFPQVNLDEYISVTPALFRSPEGTLPSYATPMMVN